MVRESISEPVENTTVKGVASALPCKSLIPPANVMVYVVFSSSTARDVSSNVLPLTSNFIFFSMGGEIETALRGMLALIHSSNSSFTYSSFGWFVVMGAGYTAATRGGNLSSGPPPGATWVAHAKSPAHRRSRPKAIAYARTRNFINQSGG